MDLKQVKTLVQLGVPQSFNALVQRFGRGARDLSITATCILLAQPGFFYEERLKRLQKVSNKRCKTGSESKGPARSKGPKQKAPANRVPQQASATPATGVSNRDAPGVDISIDEMLIQLATEGPPNTRPAPHIDSDDEDREPSPVPPCTEAYASNEAQAPFAVPAASEYVPAPLPMASVKLGKRKRKGQEQFAVELSLDEFINAEHLPVSDGRRNCRRKIIAAYYGNDRIRECFTNVLTQPSLTSTTL